MGRTQGSGDRSEGLGRSEVNGLTPRIKVILIPTRLTRDDDSDALTTMRQKMRALAVLQEESLAIETDWGYRCILDEVRALRATSTQAVHRCSRR